MSNSISEFELFYDTYSPMLYGIAIQLAPTQMQAEALLINTFKLLHMQNFHKENQTNVCLSLVKIIIQTAEHEFSQKQNALFHNAPLLNQLLSEKITVKELCQQIRINPIQLGKLIRAELNSFCTIEKSTIHFENFNKH